MTIDPRSHLPVRTPKMLKRTAAASLLELLPGNAALAADEGDPVFQDSHSVRMLRKWPYEQWLKDKQAQLGM